MSKVFFIILVISLIIAYFLPSVFFSKQILLLSSLKQISTVVLAITGAWAAIVFPDSLKNIMTKKSSHRDDMKSIKNLLKPMISSLIILGFIVCIEFTAFILSLINISSVLLPYLRFISLSIILSMYLLQIWTLIVALIPINDSYRKAKLESKKNSSIDKSRKNIQKKG